MNEYLEAWYKVARYTSEKQLLENELEELTAKIYLACTLEAKYFVGGKPPAVSLIKESYAKLGHNEVTTNRLGEIKAIMTKLEEEITMSKAVIKSAEMSLSLYQTMSANSRLVPGV